MEGGKGPGSAEYPRSQVASQNFSIIVRIWDVHFPYTPPFLSKVVLYSVEGFRIPLYWDFCFQKSWEKFCERMETKKYQGLRIQLKSTEEKITDL